MMLFIHFSLTKNGVVRYINSIQSSKLPKTAEKPLGFAAFRTPYRAIKKAMNY